MCQQECFYHCTVLLIPFTIFWKLIRFLGFFSAQSDNAAAQHDPGAGGWFGNDEGIVQWCLPVFCQLQEKHCYSQSSSSDRLQDMRQNWQRELKKASCSALIVIKNDAVQTLMNLREKFEAIFFNIHTLLPQKRKFNAYGYIKSVLY